MRIWIQRRKPALNRIVVHFLVQVRVAGAGAAGSVGTGLGAATANCVTTGYATSPDECRTHIGRSFRSMLARADLRERPTKGGTAAPGAGARDCRTFAADAALRPRCATNGTSRSGPRSSAGHAEHAGSRLAVESMASVLRRRLVWWNGPQKTKSNIR